MINKNEKNELVISLSPGIDLDDVAGMRSVIYDSIVLHLNSLHEAIDEPMAQPRLITSPRGKFDPTDSIHGLLGNISILVQLSYELDFDTAMADAETKR